MGALKGHKSQVKDLTVFKSGQLDTEKGAGLTAEEVWL